MLSEVPEGWRFEGLQKLCYRPISYGVLKPGNYEQDGQVMLRIQDVKTKFEPSLFWKISPELEKEYKRTRLNEGDIVFSVVGTLGAIKLIDASLAGANVSRAFAVIGVNSNQVCRNFVAQFLQSEIVKQWIGQAGRGGAQKVINLTEIRNLQLPLPPRTEQKRIAEVLSSVDEIIQTTQRLIEQAERVKHGLMEELLTGGLGSEAIERGEVPEGWQVKSLKSVATVVTGKTPSTKQPEFWNGDIPFITPSDLTGSLYVSESARKLTKLGAEKSKIIPKNSLIFTCIASIGKASISKVECVTNQQINSCIFTSVEDTLFYHYQLQYRLPELLSSAGKTAVAIINKGRFQLFDVIVPSTEERKRIAEVLSSVDYRVKRHKEELEELKRLKKGLMDDLLTGKVRTV